MKKNDEEIDGLLDIAIQKLDILKFHAQDINTAVNAQEKSLKKVNAHVDRARQNLDKRNSEMADLLGQYRRVGSCCKDFGLFICLIILIGCNIAVLKWKEFI